MRDNERGRVRNFFDRQAATYDRARFTLVGRREAVDKLHLRAGDTVLDLACGTGLNLPLLFPRVGAQGSIICLDLSDGMLEKARRRAHTNGCENIIFVHDDAQTFRLEPFGISEVDAVIMTYAVPTIPDYAAAIQRAIGYLKSGGTFVTTSYCEPKGYFKRHTFRAMHRLYIMRGHLTPAMDFRREPWIEMYRNMRKVRVEPRCFGFRYLAWGEK